MNPLMLIKAAPWFIAGVLALLLTIMSNLYLKERDAFTAFRAEVKTLGDQAQAEKDRIEAMYEANYKKVTESYEKQIPVIRSRAVAAYKLRYPSTSCSTVPNAPAGQQVDDGAVGQQLANPEFIQACAEDAAKVGAWQAHCIMNNCPVKE